MNEEDIVVDVGGVRMKAIEDWAQRSKRFEEVMADEQRFNEAFASAQERLKDIGVPMSYIQQIPRELFDESVKTMLLVLYAREAVQDFFSGKTIEEIESEINEEWVREAVEEAVQNHIEAVIHATVMCDGPGIAIVIGGFTTNDADDAENTEDHSAEVQ